MQNANTNVLREKQKEDRRQRILDAAEALIRETDSTDFTMQELAIRAGISPTTSYNLFGSKGAVLYALLNRALDLLIEGGEAVPSCGDPVKHVVMTMTSAAGFFIGDPALFRPLYKFQLGERALADRPRYMERAMRFWRRSVEGLVRAGRIAEEPQAGEIGRDDLAAALLTHSIGVLDLWVQEELGDDEFRARMTHDAALLLFAVVRPKDRSMLTQIMDEVRPKMAKTFSFQKSEET